MVSQQAAFMAHRITNVTQSAWLRLPAISIHQGVVFMLSSGGAGEPGSWNRYPYVGGDPVNWKDSSGLSISSADACAFGTYSNMDFNCLQSSEGNGESASVNTCNVSL
jgi:hypothetical protein